MQERPRLHRARRRPAAGPLLAGLLLVPATVSAQGNAFDCGPEQADFRLYTAAADVTWGGMTDLVTIPSLYAGERARMSVTDSVNVNREIYEERKCNWFGINCWYEKRVRNNFVTAATKPFHYTLAVPEDDGAPLHAVSEVGKTEPLPAGWGSHDVSARMALRGMVGKDDGRINRASCAGEPRICSAGAYTIKVEIDSWPRALRLVEEFGKQPFTYDRLISQDVLNANLRQSSAAVRACVGKALLRQAITFHGPGSPSTPVERQKILQQALSFAPDDSAVQTELAGTYLETGQFEKARAQTEAVIASNERLIASGNASADTYMEAARNYTTLAEVNWREVAGNSTYAANETAAKLRLAIMRLGWRIDRHPLVPGVVDARSKLVELSIRLAQVLVRLGTELDIANAVHTVAEARRMLPGRIPDALPIERDAVAGILALSRNPSRAFTNGAWQVRMRPLALSGSHGLTPAGMAPGAGGAVFLRAEGPAHVQPIQDLLQKGRDGGLIVDEACLSHAALLPGEGGAIAVDHKAGDTGHAARLLLSGKPREIAGRFGTLAVAAAADGRPRAALMTFASSAWQLRESRIDGTDEASLTFSGTGSEAVVVRAGPNRVYAVGIKVAADPAHRWSLVDFTHASPKHRELKCPSGDIDDVAFVDAPEGARLIAVGSQCTGSHAPVAIAAEGDTSKPLVLPPVNPNFPQAEVAAALKDRKSALVWATRVGEPIGILSWSETNGAPVTQSYRLLVARWSFTAAEQTATRRAVYETGIADWAAPAADPLTCGGKPVEGAPVRERFRILKLSIASAPPAPGTSAPAVDRPELDVVVAGLHGAITLETDPRFGRPLIRPTASCNAGDYVDVQSDGDGYLWARRLDGALVRLNRQAGATDACEGAALSPPARGILQRLYAPAVQKEGLLQSIDVSGDSLDPRYLARLVLASPPKGDQKRIEVPDACPLTPGFAAIDGPGSCDERGVRAAFGAPDGTRVLVLSRDISTDARRKRDRALTVERPTALLLLEPAIAGRHRVQLVRFPVTAAADRSILTIQEGAVPIAALHPPDGEPTLVAVAGDELVAFAGGSGKPQGALRVEASWLARDTTRRIVAADRLLLLRGEASNSTPQMKLILLGGGGLKDAGCGKPNCDLPSSAFAERFAQALEVGPAFNPEGRLERFAVDHSLSRLLLPVLEKADGTGFGWERWSGINLDGSGGFKIDGAAGMPLFLDGKAAYISPKAGLIEKWGIH